MRVNLLSVLHLGLLHLHDVGLTVGDAVVDVVDVGRQSIHFLVERKCRLLRLGALPEQTVPLPNDLLFALGQLLPLLRNKKHADLRPHPFSAPGGRSEVRSR